MKKKFILICLIFITVFLLTGCINGNGNGSKDANSLGGYTGFYRLRDSSLRVVQVGDTIAFKLENTDGSLYNEQASIEDNKVNGVDIKLEFSKNTVDVVDETGSYGSGIYEKEGKYEIESIIKDFLEIDEIEKNDLTGSYESGGTILNVLYIDDSSIRVKIKEEYYTLDLVVEKQDANQYYANMFDEDKFDLKVDGKKIKFDIESENATLKGFSGTYNKKSGFSNVDIIKTFVID